MKAQLTMENGKRWSTDKVLQKSNYPNLTILTYARATKVNLKNIFRITFLTYIKEIYKSVIIIKDTSEFE